jgi:hypothetical protein
MAVAASSNGDLVASASLDSTVRVWGEDSTEKGEIVCVARLCQDDGDSAYAVSFSPDDATVIAAVGCVVKVWNFIANECVTLVGHTDVVRGVAVSYDAVVSCSADESLRIWGISKAAEALDTAGADPEVWGALEAQVSDLASRLAATEAANRILRARVVLQPQSRPRRPAGGPLPGHTTAARPAQVSRPGTFVVQPGYPPGLYQPFGRPSAFPASIPPLLPPGMLGVPGLPA